MRAAACAFAALTAMCVFQSAHARDTGTINQTGVYEQTMRFYLHPAHLYWSSEAPQPMSQHPAVLVKQKAPTDEVAITTVWPHPGLTRKRQEHKPSEQSGSVESHRVDAARQDTSMASAARRAPIAGANLNP